MFRSTFQFLHGTSCGLILVNSRGTEEVNLQQQDYARHSSDLLQLFFHFLFIDLDGFTIDKSVIINVRGLITAPASSNMQRNACVDHSHDPISSLIANDNPLFTNVKE